MNSFRKIIPIVFSFTVLFPLFSFAQLKWKNVDSLFQPLPSSVHVYYTNDSLDGKPNIAYYVEADLKDKKLDFTADTTLGRRFTPKQFYEKNNKPLLVVNCTFFSFQTNQNLSVVIKDRKLVSYNPEYVIGRRKKDTAARLVPRRGAIGITKKRVPDIAWVFTDSSRKYYYAEDLPRKPLYRYQDAFDQSDFLNYDSIELYLGKEPDLYQPKNWDWKMKTAVGGGPVLLQKGKIFITNEEEMMFRGKAINDKHPRTAMGYTKDNTLIILVVQGRSPGIAEGATLTQEAQILKDLGCWEALNLDGGGSSCMLVNGKETIKPSDITGQRPVPAVFIIRKK